MRAKYVASISAQPYTKPVSSAGPPMSTQGYDDEEEIVLPESTYEEAPPPLNEYDETVSYEF